MREILFRGKRKDSGEWVEGLLWKKKYDTPKLFISCFPDKDDNEEVFVIYPETVGQYTGLTDKNGTKIFEGDIVQGKDRLEKHLEVFGYIDHKDGTFVITGDFMTHYRWLDYEVEVIGNIHDNPELLKGCEG